MTPETVHDFVRHRLPTLCKSGVSSEAGFALPPASLALLGECVSLLGVERVFEFGSGRSTHTFLTAGCAVTTVEDSEAWLAETVRELDASAQARFTSFRLPLVRVSLSGAPMQSWMLPDAALSALSAAQLVLVDSPAWPPFREHALALALEHAREALVVVDDARIPTVSRFCRRLAERNDAPCFHAEVDHGLFFFGPATRDPLDTRRPLLETLKAWRRYFLARKAA